MLEQPEQHAIRTPSSEEPPSSENAPECAGVCRHRARTGHDSAPAKILATCNYLEAMVGRYGIEPPTPVSVLVLDHRYRQHLHSLMCSTTNRRRGSEWRPIACCRAPSVTVSVTSIRRVSTA